MYNQMMRYLKEDRIIKASQENITKNLKELAEITYPYTLLKSEEIEGFLLCGVMQCFTNVNDVKMVQEALQKTL
jgi:Glu-tRNA(Gln) amidotransferase subunit E-like FAD-binding protein